MNPAPRTRCVYVYYRRQQTKNGIITCPYYVGKGTIRRAYDWVRHTNVRSPAKAEDIHIMGKDMTDVDAQQAEVLLIHLYGRKLDRRFEHTIRPSWASQSYRTDVTGTLENRTTGGDGPASTDPKHVAMAETYEAHFRENNPCWALVRHESGYWYAPEYPRIKSTKGVWIRKKGVGLGTVRPKTKTKRKHRVRFDLALRVDAKLPNDMLRYEERAHYERFGNIDCAYRYGGDCRCDE